MKKTNRYSSYFWKHKGKIFVITILGIFSTLAGLYSKSLLGTLVEELTSHNLDNLFSYAGLIAIVEAITFLTKFISEKLSLKTKTSIVRSLHWDLGGILAKASAESVDQNKISDLTERLREGQNYVNAVADIFDESFSLMKGFIALVITFCYSWQIGILFIVFIIIILVQQIITINKIKNLKKLAASASDNSRQLNYEIIEGFSAIKSQGLISGLKKYYSSNIDTEYNLNLDAENLFINNRYVSRQLISLATVSFIILGGILTINNQIALNVFVTLFMYMTDVGNLVDSVIRIAKNKTSLNLSISRMNQLFNYQIISKEHFGNIRLDNPSGLIEIKHLTVEFNGKKVIDNLSTIIPAGKFVGIIGSSGCGKSTLMKVIARLQTPVSGEILLDGLNALDLDQVSYCRAIKMAPQTPYLFTLSVKENMLLANPEASDNEIWDALRECDAEDFVREKGGLDCVIPSNALSGGQKQRLALSRIIINGSKIVLLDESTSALDNNSQKIVINAIREATNNGHTIILVAHRIQCLKNSDLILHLENGKIIESGTYSELYERSERFRHMVDG